MAGSITHGGTLPDSSAKADFYAIIDNASLSSIANADIAAGAAIAATKLDLTNISSNMTYNASNKPKRTIVLTAAGATVPSTNGAAQVQTDGTNLSYWTLGFDKDTDESAFWAFKMPDSYDDSTIYASLDWIAGSGGVSAETVEFDLSFLGFVDGEVLDTATVSACTLTDTALTAATTVVHNAAQVSAASTFAAGDFVVCKVNRDVSEDNLGGDANVLTVKLEWAKDQDTD